MTLGTGDESLFSVPLKFLNPIIFDGDEVKLKQRLDRFPELLRKIRLMSMPKRIEIFTFENGKSGFLIQYFDKKLYAENPEEALTVIAQELGWAKDIQRVQLQYDPAKVDREISKLNPPKKLK